MATLTGTGTITNSAFLGCASGTCTYLNNAGPYVSDAPNTAMCTTTLQFLDASGITLFSVNPAGADSVAFACINGVLYVTYDDNGNRCSFSGVTSMICT